MRVLKFGGTSVGSAQRMQEVAQIVNNGVPKIVVLSAMTGTTNQLVAFAQYLSQQNADAASELLKRLEKHYFKTIEQLYSTNTIKTKALESIKNKFDLLRTFKRAPWKESFTNVILAQGELLSTAMFNFYLEEIGIHSTLLPALNFMRTDQNGEPDSNYIQEHLLAELQAHSTCEMFVTQGFICMDDSDQISNLQRGGSDYSASIIGAAVGSDEIQIWTDIDGFHNNDPRVVERTRPISHLSFDEAAELAYFGAKIMHPSSVLPAQMANIPVRLKNTMAPEEQGTLISDFSQGAGIRAVAAKDGITAIKIKSGRMLLAYGFLRKIFDVFENFRTPIDMVTTSEVTVSVTIDSVKYLDEIVHELKKYATVEVDENQSIVCVVGDFGADKSGMAAQVFDAVKDIPVRMISYGGSEHNISMVVDTRVKVDILKALNVNLLGN